METLKQILHENLLKEETEEETQKNLEGRWKAYDYLEELLSKLDVEELENNIRRYILWYRPNDKKLYLRYFENEKILYVESELWDSVAFQHFPDSWHLSHTKDIALLFKEVMYEVGGLSGIKHVLKHG